MWFHGRVNIPAPLPPVPSLSLVISQLRLSMVGWWVLFGRALGMRLDWLGEIAGQIEQLMAQFKAGTLPLTEPRISAEGASRVVGSRPDADRAGAAGYDGHAGSFAADAAGAAATVSASAAVDVVLTAGTGSDCAEACERDEARALSRVVDRFAVGCPAVRDAFGGAKGWFQDGSSGASSNCDYFVTIS
jgi:hypothetical protein